MKAIDAIIDRISDILAYIAGLILIYIVISITVDVLFRYLFNNPLPYTLDISEILLHFITFLTAAWVMKRDGHVKMDLLLSTLRKKISGFSWESPLYLQPSSVLIFAGTVRLSHWIYIIGIFFKALCSNIRERPLL